jgi:hypothetical protein
MRRSLLLVVLVVVLAGGVGRSPHAAADPNPDLANAKHFVLDCGAAGRFDVVFVESGLGTFHVTDGTGIFQSTSLAIDGVLIAAEPGFLKNGRGQVTCTFVGVVTGRQFTVTGFFTPASR